MTHIEMVEKLRERADVNYADAKDALERSGWDLLDAMILLERDGKVRSEETAISYKPSKQGGYSTKGAENDCCGDNGQNKKEPGAGAKFSDFMNKMLKWLGKIIGKGNENSFVIEKNGAKVITFPVTVLVILLVIGFYVAVPLIIIGLFFGFRYSFMGSDLGRDNINNVMNKAASTVDGIKEEFNKCADSGEANCEEESEKI